MNLKPWREVMKPYKDVISGESRMADFAADLMQVVRGMAPLQYQNAALFYQYTYLTEGTKTLLLNVARRVCGLGGDPVIQLQTGFGGGKTHTMLAVYHMVKGDVPSSMLLGLKDLLADAHIGPVPTCRIAVLDGVSLGPNEPKHVKLSANDSINARTLWGVIGAALGGREGYELVRSSDESGVSPGKDVLIELLRSCSPCVILVDELVAYIRQFNDGETLLGGTFGSNLSFVQALTEAVKSVPTAVLLASLPESVHELGGDQGEKALEALAHHFGRVQALWKPVEKEESFEIVRRRLFQEPDSPEERERVCDAFFEMYRTQSGDFPSEAQEASYREQLRRSYPIHPEIFNQLYSHWTTLERFQRTRGVLKMMSNAIYYLWTHENQDLMIMPASLPLCDSQTQGIFTEPLENAGWTNIISTDIDGEKSQANRIDTGKSYYGSISAAKRVCRTVFLATAPLASATGKSVEIHRGIDLKRLFLGTVRPGDNSSVYREALRELSKHCFYLYTGEGETRAWFHITPNMTTEMQSRRKRFNNIETTKSTIKGMLQNLFTSSIFNAVHVFTEAQDIPDDETLRLVILSPEKFWNREATSPARLEAAAILERRGSALRTNRNRLLFLACDSAASRTIREDAATLQAWKSIVEDAGAGKLNLDMNSLKTANDRVSDSDRRLRKLLESSFTHLMSPYYETSFTDLHWDDFIIPDGGDRVANRLVAKLEEEEVVIHAWAARHLANLLEKLFWARGMKTCKAEDVWHIICREAYCARLLNREVFRKAISDGSNYEDWFGIAQKNNGDGTYQGFSFGRHVDVILDDSLTLISAEEARRYREISSQSKPTVVVETQKPNLPSNPTISKTSTQGETPPLVEKNRTFNCTIEIGQQSAKSNALDALDALRILLDDPTIHVTIQMDVHAETAEGFSEAQERAIRENLPQLGCENGEFLP